MIDYLLKSTMSIYKWDIHFKVLEDGNFPTFKGSLFRGVFGRAFKKVSCSMYHGECNKCSVSNTCAYFKIFNLENEEEKNNGILYTPRPYCFRNLPTNNRVKQDELISIGFTLLGESNRDYLPFLLFSYKLMDTYQYGKYQLKLEFMNIVDTLYNNKYDLNDDIPSDFGLIPNQHKNFEREGFEIHFSTPVRIKILGKHVFQLDKYSLINSIKNRYKILHENFGIFYKEDLEDIDDFEVIVIQEKSTNNKRYSARQNKKHYLPGIIGKYKIITNNKKLYNILKRLENLQIGKSTTFGFGQFKIID
jgi:hypothetical protein